MSYVLDALRRAEADRHRGEVPGLHAPAPAPLGPAATPATASRTPWVFGALAALALAGAALWWGVMRGPNPAPSGAPAPAAVTPSAAVATPPAPAPRAEPLAAGPTSAPPSSGAPGAGDGPAAEAPAAPVSAAADVPPPVALPEPRRPPVAAAAGPLPSPPPMQFGGAFDSPDPKARMLIINGQVWREGDEPVPGWVLERISLHAAQFRVQGRTVSLPYDGRPARP